MLLCSIHELLRLITTTKDACSLTIRRYKTHSRRLILSPELLKLDNAFASWARTSARRPAERKSSVSGTNHSIFLDLHHFPTHFQKPLSILSCISRDTHRTLSINQIPRLDQERHGLRVDLVLCPEEVQDDCTNNPLAILRRSARSPTRRITEGVIFYRS